MNEPASQSMKPGLQSAPGPAARPAGTARDGQGSSARILLAEGQTHPWHPSNSAQFTVRYF